MFKRTTKKPPSKKQSYPYEQMKRGESFVIKASDEPIDKVYNRLRSLSYHWNKKLGPKKKFTTTIDREKNEVWVTREK